MNRWSASAHWLHPWTRTFAIAVAVLASGAFVAQHGHLLDFPLNTPDEYRHYINHGGVNFLGIWNMWSERTIDYERPIHTGLYYYTSLAVGVVLSPFLGAEIRDFAFAARLTAMLMWLGMVWCLLLLLGRHLGWHPVLALVPIGFLVKPEWLVLATRVYSDGTMLLLLLLTLWGFTRFLEQPGPRSYRTASVLMTLAFAAKPAVLPLYPFFIALNAYQVWRDGQPFWQELRWRLLKGVMYFFVTFLLASPFTATSFGLFLASMRSEAAATATKFVLRPWTDWIRLLADPDFVGLGWLVAGVLIIAAWLAWSWRVYVRGKAPVEFGQRMLLVSLVWLLFFGAFVMTMSHSFIPRYLDPAVVPFMLVLFGAAVWMGRRDARVGWALSALLLVLTVQSAQYGLPRQEVYAARMEQEIEALPMWRSFNADLQALLPADAHILYTPFLLVDRERLTHTERFHRLRRYHFLRNRPEYLLLSTQRLDFYEDFLDYDEAYSQADAERMATAEFWKDVDDTQLGGRLELVREWGPAKARLYRFTQPVDEAFVDALFTELYAKIGVPEPDTR